MTSFPGGRTGLALTILMLGVVGEFLMFHGHAGLGVSLWMLLIAGAALRVSWTRTEPTNRAARVPLVAALVFAALHAFRDAEPLRITMQFLWAGSLLLAAWPRAKHHFLEATTGEHLRTLRDGVLLGLPLPLQALFLLNRPQQRDEHRAARSRAVIRGLLLAVPALLLLGGLLVNAEPAFAQWMDSILDLQALVTGSWHSALSAWWAAALLVPFLRRDALQRRGGARGVWKALGRRLQRVMYPDVEPEDDTPASPPPVGFTFGIIEANVVLGSVAVLFVAFIVVQAGALFGGHAHVLAKAHLTVADYARTGFFELSAVAALAMALLLACGATRAAAGPTARRVQQWLFGVTIAAVLLITLSAFQRMSLYTALFGLTRMRVYVFFALSGLAIAFLWLAFTSFTERHRRFAFGALLILYATALGLEVVNIDDLVVRANLPRMRARLATTAWQDSTAGSMYGDYLGGLGADAVPAIVDGLLTLPPERQAAFRPWLLGSAPKTRLAWREWTWGSARAQAAYDRLRATPLPTPPSPPPSSPADTTGGPPTMETASPRGVSETSDQRANRQLALAKNCRLVARRIPWRTSGSQPLFTPA